MERQRYTRLATGITLASIAGVWLFGGVPRAPVGTVQAQPVTYDPALAARGAVLFQEFGCQACHSVNGAPGVGPTMQNVYNHPVRLTDGSVILADEAFVREFDPQPQRQGGQRLHRQHHAHRGAGPPPGDLSAGEPERPGGVHQVPRRRGRGGPRRHAPGDARGRLARRP